MTHTAAELGQKRRDAIRLLRKITNADTVAELTKMVGMARAWLAEHDREMNDAG